MSTANDDEDVLPDDEELDDTPTDRTRYGTSETRSLAYSTYQRLSSSSPKLDEEEERAFNQYEKSANEVRAQLAAARDSLLKKRQDKSQALLAAAAGLLRPTRTGSIGESAGNALEGALPELQKERTAADVRQKQALDLGASIGGIDQNLAALRIRLIQARRAASSKLLSESLKIASRPDKPGARVPAQSPFGKIAADEGLRQGSPEFVTRVQELRDQDQALQREKSGVDVSEGLSMEDRQGLGARFGVPVASIDPYQGLSTKQRQVARQRAAQQSNKELDTLGQNISGLSKTDTDVDRFLFLNKDVSSGQLRGLNPFPGAAGDEMDSITARMARQVRQPGEGQISNYDAQQFVRGTLSRTKPYAANINIGKALKLNTQQQRDRIKFFNDYATVNDGSLNGAMGAWIQYLDDNPIFDPKTPGSFVLNPARKSYEDYFRQKGGQRFAAGGKVSTVVRFLKGRYKDNPHSYARMLDEHGFNRPLTTDSRYPDLLMRLRQGERLSLEELEELKNLDAVERYTLGELNVPEEMSRRLRELTRRHGVALPSDPLYRGVAPERARKILDKLEIGQEMPATSRSGFASTSTDPSVAIDFAKNGAPSLPGYPVSRNNLDHLVLEYLPTNQKTLPLPESGESEILLPKGRRHKVLDIEKQRGRRHVVLEDLPDAEKLAEGGKVDLVKRLVAKIPKKPGKRLQGQLNYLEKHVNDPEEFLAFHSADDVHSIFPTASLKDRDVLIKRLDQLKDRKTREFNKPYPPPVLRLRQDMITTSTPGFGVRALARSVPSRLVQSHPLNPAATATVPIGFDQAQQIKSTVQAMVDQGMSLQDVLATPGIPKRLAPFYQREYKLASGEGGLDENLGYAGGGEVEQDTVVRDTSSKARQRLQAALQGVTYGLSDELGGLGTLATQGDYEQGRDFVRQTLEEGSNESPASTFATEAVGSLAPTMAAQQVLSKLAKKYDVKRIGRANSKTGRAIQMLARIAPKSKLMKAVATGATAGGVAGLNSEGDLAKRVQNAQNGALFGAAIGPVANKSTDMAGKAVRKVWDRVTGKGLAAAEERLAAVMANDEVNPAAVAAQSAADARTAVPSRVADFGGPETQALAQSSMSRSGPQARALLDETQQLQRGARDRVEDRVNRSLKPDPFFDQESKLVGQLKTNAEPLYQAANKVNVPVTPELQAILNTPTGKRAYAQALRNMADEQVSPAQAPDGSINTQVLHYTKEALSNMAQSASPDSQAARVYNDLQRKLVAQLDRSNPLYGKARIQYGDDTEVLGALRLGRTGLLDLQPEQIAAHVADLSFAARDALRTGVARNLLEEIRAPRRAKNFAELINSPVLSQQLGAVFERPGDAKIFIAALQRESQLYGTRATAARTAGQLQGQDIRTSLASNPAGELFGAASEGAGIGSAVMGQLGGLQIVSRVLGALRNRITLSDSAAEDISRLLRTGSPAEVKKMMDNFERFTAIAKQRRETDEKLGHVVSGAAAGAFGSPAPQGYQQQ